MAPARSRRDAGWTAARMPRLDGRRAIVTGASNGVGLETARALAAAGAHVVLAVRNPGLGRQRAAQIEGSTEVGVLDLADLASVRAFADTVTEPVDLLINNAGVAPLRHERTVDGFEVTLGTNFLGPYALTSLLLPRITGRVVNVCSGSHRVGRLDPDDLHLESGWRGPRAYGSSKLALLAWTLDLDRALRSSGSPVRALAADPGWAASNISNKPGLAVAHSAALALARVVGHDTTSAARSSLVAATEALPGGAYVGFDGRGGHRGRVALIGRSATASDPTFCRWVSQMAAAETGIAPDLAAV